MFRSRISEPRVFRALNIYSGRGIRHPLQDRPSTLPSGPSYTWESFLPSPPEPLAARSLVTVHKIDRGHETSGLPRRSAGERTNGPTSGVRARDRRGLTRGRRCGNSRDRSRLARSSFRSPYLGPVVIPVMKIGRSPRAPTIFHISAVDRFRAARRTGNFILSELKVTSVEQEWTRLFQMILVILVIFRDQRFSH